MIVLNFDELKADTGLGVIRAKKIVLYKRRLIAFSAA